MLGYTAVEGEEGGPDDDYACVGSEADDEATLEEEDALAAQDVQNQKVCPPFCLAYSFSRCRTTLGDGVTSAISSHVGSHS